MDGTMPSLVTLPGMDVVFYFVFFPRIQAFDEYLVCKLKTVLWEILSL